MMETENVVEKGYECALAYRKEHLSSKLKPTGYKMTRTETRRLLFVQRVLAVKMGHILKGLDGIFSIKLAASDVSGFVGHYSTCTLQGFKAHVRQVTIEDTGMFRTRR